MTGLGRLAFTSAACFTLCACGAPSPVDPAANGIDDLPANVVVDAGSPVMPQPASPRDVETSRTSRPANEEPRMPQPTPTTNPPPARQPVPPPAKPPAPPPRRVILPSPTQPPAEVDPVQPYPGDEVPR